MTVVHVSYAHVNTRGHWGFGDATIEMWPPPNTPHAIETIRRKLIDEWDKDRYGELKDNQLVIISFSVL